jgi:hypothetical protein
MVQADYGNAQFCISNSLTRGSAKSRDRRSKAQYRPALFHNFGQIFGHKKSASKLADLF